MILGMPIEQTTERYESRSAQRERTATVVAVSPLEADSPERVTKRMNRIAAAEAARALHPEALDVGLAHRRLDRLAHRTAERHALFQLQRDRFRYQLRIQFRLVHFLDVNKHFPAGLLRQVLLQLLDFRALAADDDTRTLGLDRDPQLVARTVHFNRADAGGLQPFAQGVLQLEVFSQQLRVVLLGEPPRPPSLGDSHPEPVGMCFLSH